MSQIQLILVPPTLIHSQWKLDILSGNVCHVGHVLYHNGKALRALTCDGTWYVTVEIGFHQIPQDDSGAETGLWKMGLLDTWRKTHQGVGWERLIIGLGICSYFGFKLKAVQLGCAISTLPLVVSLNTGVKFKRKTCYLPSKPLASGLFWSDFLQGFP